MKDGPKVYQKNREKGQASLPLSLKQNDICLVASVGVGAVFGLNGPN